jgi:hypothetical protein
MVNDDALASISPPFLLFALGRIHGATVLFGVPPAELDYHLIGEMLHERKI